MIYLDHNASTPVRPEVSAAMRSCLEELHGNASSLHREGQRARAAVERAREQVAALVNARPAEVVFVSGGTEGDHLGVVGGAWAQRDQGRRVAISAVEHHAVHGAVEVLGELGFAADHLPVTADGVLELGSLDGLAPGTVMVAVMLANNETGVPSSLTWTSTRSRCRGRVSRRRDPGRWMWRRLAPTICFCRDTRVVGPRAPEPWCSATTRRSLRSSAAAATRLAAAGAPRTCRASSAWGWRPSAPPASSPPRARDSPGCARGSRA